ncbi:MAG: CRISPR-associated endonuclease Cas2 [Verrucomicrobiaceae bacterium]|nr:MAG: CRISPR-associated endonuclease Cas2 [Verrucomicrobiaceae bacterium]
MRGSLSPSLLTDSAVSHVALPASAQPTASSPDWYDDLLPPAPPYRNPPACDEMLRLIAYDITCPKRLRRIATACEDYGLRIQKSLFECWLEHDRFDQLWQRLNELIDPSTDSLAAYVIDESCVDRRRSAGSMCFTHRRHWYIL